MSDRSNKRRQADGTPDRARARRRTLFGAAVAVLLVGASCGGDDSGNSDRGDSDPAESSTTTAQPTATGDDQAEAFRLVEDVVTDATVLTDQLMQEPGNPDEADVARLRQLYTDDSPTPDSLVARMEELAAAGQHERAAASGIFRELGVYELVADDADTVRFRICATEDIETVDRDGKVVAMHSQVTQATGEARRVEGVWRFYGMRLEPDRTLPIRPGSATAGFCDTLFADDETEGTDAPA